MTSKQTQVRSTEEALSVYDTLKLALEALKKSDGFLYNWHENYSDDEADAYAAARQLNEQAIIAAEKALMSFQDGAQPEQNPNGLAAYVIGCFRAAEVEGLQEALAETTDERLKDLVERRLMYALYEAQEPQPKEPEQVGINGLTEAETNATASVFGLVNAAPPYVATPRQRTWVGLTHEDIDKAIEDNQRFGGFRKVGFAYDLELVLKEKNT